MCFMGRKLERSYLEEKKKHIRMVLELKSLDPLLDMPKNIIMATIILQKERLPIYDIIFDGIS